MCDSELEQKKCTIIWKIQNFNFCGLGYEEEICKTSFETEMIGNSSWKLRLYSKGRLFNLAFHLKRKYDGKPRVKIGFSVFVVGVDGNDKLIAEEPSNIFEKGQQIKYETKAQINTLKSAKYLQRGTLILKCHLWKHQPINIMSNTSFVITQIKVQRNAYTWAIKRFSSNKAEQLKIPLSSYSIGETEVEFFYSNDDSDKFVQLDVCFKGNFCRENYIAYKVSLLDAKGNPQSSVQQQHVLGKENKKIRLPSFIEKFTIITKKSTYLPKDTLNLYIVLFTSGGVEDSKSVGRFAFPGYDKLGRSAITDTLRCDLLRLYTEKKSCDVTLSAENKDFPAHKVILSARCPVFDTMFQNDMLENQTGIVIINDLEAGTLEKLLLFIYSDNLHISDWESAAKLYSAADKYQIRTLKEKCSSFLKLNLSEACFCEVLMLADKYQDNDLKSTVQDFICMFGDEFLQSEKWKNLMEDRIELTSEVLYKVSLQLLQSDFDKGGLEQMRLPDIPCSNSEEDTTFD